MKCPKCGAEISTVEMLETLTDAQLSEYVENEDGTFSYHEAMRTKTVDSQIEEVRCPECEKPLKWHFGKEGELVIDGVSN